MSSGRDASSTDAGDGAGSASAGTRPLPDLVCLTVRPQSLTISYGDTVFATGREGWLDEEPETGLFVRQTRLLSRYRIHLGRHRPLLAAHSLVRQDRWLGYYLVRAPGQDGGDEQPGPQSIAQQALELRVSRIVGDGMHEDLDLTNHTREPVTVRLALAVDGDFADLDETKEERQQQGELRRSWRRDGDAWEWRLDYSASRRFQHGAERGTARIDRTLTLRIANADSPPTRRGGRIGFDVELPPHGRWHACLDWRAAIDGETLPPPPCSRDGAEHRPETRWDHGTAVSSAESGTLAQVVLEAMERARRDLAGLRLHRYDDDGRAWTVAAGVPMYVALFGRDTQMAAMQAALFGPELLRGTLPLLAERQGREDNPWRDERPGRILHEAHEGPLAALNVNPKARHYGSLTSASLFAQGVVALWDWTGDRDAVQRLLPNALAALDWLDGDACLHGFHGWTTRSKKGIANQTWKDSEDGIVHADGEPAEHPVAACEEQAHVYAAKVGLARVLRALGDTTGARRLAASAAALQERFDAAFWCDDLGTYAMALAKDGTPIRSVGSNPLHTLASGLAPRERRAAIVERLFRPDMFSGWGLRTLSSDHPGYNPYAYHRGCVWPVEHGPAADGLRRAGDIARMQQLCRAMFETASMFTHRRLPECFSGHARDDEHPFPALYPAANAPQAWSASVVPAMVQVLLGAQADAPSRRLIVDPRLPDWLPTLRLRGLRVGDARVDVDFRRDPDGTSSFTVTDLDGELEVLREDRSGDAT